MIRPNDLTAVILAGGESRRMGQNKALLSLEGRSFLERVAAAAQPLVQSVVLVDNGALAAHWAGVLLGGSLCWARACGRNRNGFVASRNASCLGVELRFALADDRGAGLLVGAECRGGEYYFFFGGALAAVGRGVCESATGNF